MRFHLYRIPLNREGYDSTGQYFGVGMPLYRAEHYSEGPDDDYVIRHYRAWDRESAKGEIRAGFPAATFYR